MDQQPETPDPEKSNGNDKASKSVDRQSERAAFAEAEAGSLLVRGGPIYRSFYNRTFAGVCSGLSIPNGIPATLGQILGLVLLIFTGGTFLIVYLVLWLLIPMEPVPEDIKSQMSNKRWSAVLIAIAILVAFVIVTSLLNK